MTIEVEVRDIEEAKTKDGENYHRVTMLETGAGALPQFMTWSVMGEYSRDIKDVKLGSVFKYKIRNIAANYDGSLRVRGSIVNK